MYATIPKGNMGYDQYAVPELKTTRNTFRDCRVHSFPTTFLEIAVYKIVTTTSVLITSKYMSIKTTSDVCKKLLHSRSNTSLPFGVTMLH